MGIPFEIPAVINDGVRMLSRLLRRAKAAIGMIGRHPLFGREIGEHGRLLMVVSKHGTVLHQGVNAFRPTIDTPSAPDYGRANLSETT